MIDIFPYAGMPVAVLGLGKSGLATAKALMSAGANVMAWDDGEEARAQAQAAQIPLVDLRAIDWSEMGTLVISPGIPHTWPKPHPIARMARTHCCAIIGDIELLAQAQRDAAYIGITGTNGKSTTTALTGHLLREAGVSAAVGGNLGVPVLEFDTLGAGGVYVLEVSSYQLELIRSLVFSVAVMLNLSADHLERHGGMAGYLAAKRRIFRGQSPTHTAVIGIDDEASALLYDELRCEGGRRLIPVSGKRVAQGGVFAADGWLVDDTQGTPLKVFRLADAPALPGAHNAQNAAAAYAVARAAGITPSEIAKGLASFPGLAHRQERIAEIDGVLYVNDSKATNADAAVRALTSYQNIYWIAGGRPKEGGLEGVEAGLPNVRRAFLIGEAAQDFGKWLSGRVEATQCGDLATALSEARKAAKADGMKGAVVLLSPACASFDQFKSFEHRGTRFRSLVEDLQAGRPLGGGAGVGPQAMKGAA